MTTQTELRALLEDAAYAMGFTAWCFDGDAFCVSTEPDVSDPDDIAYVGWQPDLNSADGAEMCLKLKISTEWWGSGFDCYTLCDDERLYTVTVMPCADDDSTRRHWRMASLRVAAAICKAKREQEAE